jgi:formyl-CoA transferase
VTRPLSGIRVLDLTNVLAGPYCCYQLGLLGAEVIKVERPETGDLARELGADPARNARGMGISFLAQNAGKASVTLDLKAPKGKALLKRLVKTTDVLVENFRPGVMDRLELGYEALRNSNANLIYCAISGFGQTGPRREDPAYDQIVQGVSGVMSITGTPETAPNRVGYPLADTVGGMTAAFAISAALNAKPRGAFLDIAMTEAVISTMGWVVSNHLIGGVTPAAQGNENPTSAPSGTFSTADHPINIAANRDMQWVSLAKHLGRSDLIHDPRFDTRERRKTNREVLRVILEDRLRTRPAATWVAELNALGVPSGPVLSVADALQDPQLVSRNLIAQVHSHDETLALAGSPVVMDGQRGAPASGPPELGADNTRIWAELGLDAAEIAELKTEGLI